MRSLYRVEYATLYRDGREVWFRTTTIQNENDQEALTEAREYSEDLKEFHNKVRIVKIAVSNESVVA